jgi:hypothetical protein
VGLSVGRGLKAAVTDTVSFARQAWPWILAFVFLLAAAFVLWRFWRSRARSPGGGGLEPYGPRHRAAAAFKRMTDTLARVGLARQPSQTALEFGRQADALLGSDLGGRAARLFNRARFALEVAPDELDELDAIVGRIEVEVATKKKPRAS